MNTPRPHVVFDCYVLFQAFARPNGPAARCLKLVEHNAVSLFLSKAILREFRKILDYPEIREKNVWITDHVIDDFISHLRYRSAIIDHVPNVSDLPRDPADEPYLDLAAAANADFLVTRDKDLLSLQWEHNLSAKQIRQQLPALKICTPEDFLALITSPDGA